MKYNHVVKANGEYYPAGVEIPAPKEIEELPFSDTEIEMETEPVRRGRPRKNS